MASQSSRRVVFLGTGTNVGKTYVSAGLVQALTGKSPHLKVAALKPVETGVVAGVAEDARALERVSNIALPTPHPLYTFSEPISPHLAARRAGIEIDLQSIVAWVASASSGDSAADVVVVETAGGAFSPLTERLTNVDLACALEPAIWVLVVPDALGALHDTRATLLALEHTAARRPDFVIVSAARERDAATGTTAAELVALGLASRPLVVSRNASDGIEALASALLAP
jgi:dethiobiotin synthetase